MSQMIVWCPFGELDLCNGLRLQPDAAFHFFLGQCPLSSFFLGEVGEQARVRSQVPLIFSGKNSRMEPERRTGLGFGVKEGSISRIRPASESESFFLVPGKGGPCWPILGII